MDFVATLLAVAGFVAVALRLLGAGFEVLRWAVDAFAARERARTRARRGDLTGMAEAHGQLSSARRERWRAAAAGALWLVLLLFPPFTPWARPLYAAYGVIALGVLGARAVMPAQASPRWYRR